MPRAARPPSSAGLAAEVAPAALLGAAVVVPAVAEEVLVDDEDTTGPRPSLLGTIVSVRGEGRGMSDGVGITGTEATRGPEVTGHNMQSAEKSTQADD
jgi:hypothetical protein